VDFEKYPSFYLGVAVSLAGSIISGFAWLMTRKLGNKVSAVQNVLYFGCYCILLIHLIQIVVRDPMCVYGVREWTLMIAMGMSGWVGQHFLTLALQGTAIAKVAPINYLQVVIAWLADVFLFGHEATFVELLGTFCIVFFTFLNSVQKGFCA
jgi:drug/metabolite transporter (DMT)-like permease